MKQYLYTASVEQGSKKIISTTNSDWSKVVAGSLVRFKDDPLFYFVSKTEKAFIFEKFESIDGRTIRIPAKMEFILSKNDEINITWNEFELSTVSSILSSGANYKENDIIECEGGEPTENKTDGSFNRARFKVTEIDANGQIKRISLESRGQYFSPPNKSACGMIGGAGSGATLDLIFFQREIKGADRKNIQLVNAFESETRVLLDSAIPRALKCGQLTLTKWEAILDKPYEGESKNNAPYELFYEFTPFCKMPMPAKNALGLDLLLKNTQLILDSKIELLSNEVDKLKKRISEMQECRRV